MKIFSSSLFIVLLKERLLKLSPPTPEMFPLSYKSLLQFYKLIGNPRYLTSTGVITLEAVLTLLREPENQAQLPSA